MGLVKRLAVRRAREKVRVELQQVFRTAFDRTGILNPGGVI
ncbi:MAG: hypothetical protein ACK4K6_13080 [Pseudarthrobacter sp.]